MAFVLREATLDDLHPIMGIETSTFDTDAWSIANMLDELAGQHSWYLVAVDDAAPEVIVGYGGLMAAPGGSQADIQTIAVSEGARRRGLGRELMAAMIAEARDRGARELFLEVRADNSGAQALYLDLGFEQISVRKKYYQPDGVDANVMRLTLAPSRSVGAVGR